MKKLLLSLFLLNASAALAQPSRTLNDLIQIALEKGEAGTLGTQAASSVGVDKNTPTKEIWFDQGVVSDGREHVFTLLLDGEKPKGIILTHSKMTETTEAKFLEGTKHYLDISGKVLSVATYSGKVGHLKFAKSTPKKAKALAKKELEFWTNESQKYEWSK